MNGWDVGSCTLLFNLFSGASYFNQDISSWDVSAVTNMVGLNKVLLLHRGVSDTPHSSCSTNCRPACSVVRSVPGINQVVPLFVLTLSLFTQTLLLIKVGLHTVYCFNLESQDTSNLSFRCSWDVSKVLVMQDLFWGMCHASWLHCVLSTMNLIVLTFAIQRMVTLTNH